MSVYPYTDETGQVNGYVASNSVSAVSDVGDAPALIDAATEAAPIQINGAGPQLVERRGALPAGAAKAVADACLNAEVLAKASGRSLGDHDDRRGRRDLAGAAVPRGHQGGRGLRHASRSRSAGDVRDGERHFLLR